MTRTLLLKPSTKPKDTLSSETQAGAPEDVPADVRRLPVPWIFDGDGVQPHRCPAPDVSRQDADNARKHDLARDDCRRRLTRNQHSR
jgi:hypothetical protein